MLIALLQKGASNVSSVTEPSHRPLDRRYSGTDASPDTGQPWLFVTRQAGRAVIVSKLDETRGRDIPLPSFEIMIRAVAPVVPAFLVIAARV